jgi:hypothetical protein
LGHRAVAAEPTEHTWHCLAATCDFVVIDAGTG